MKKYIFLSFVALCALFFLLSDGSNAISKPSPYKGIEIVAGSYRFSQLHDQHGTFGFPTNDFQRMAFEKFQKIGLEYRAHGDRGIPEIGLQSGFNFREYLNKFEHLVFFFHIDPIDGMTFYPPDSVHDFAFVYFVSTKALEISEIYENIEWPDYYQLPLTNFMTYKIIKYKQDDRQDYISKVKNTADELLDVKLILPICNSNPGDFNCDYIYEKYTKLGEKK